MRKKTTSGKPVLGQYVLNQKKEKWFQLCELYVYASEKANFRNYVQLSCWCSGGTWMNDTKNLIKN